MKELIEVFKTVTDAKFASSTLTELVILNQVIKIQFLINLQYAYLCNFCNLCNLSNLVTYVTYGTYGTYVTCIALVAQL